MKKTNNIYIFNDKKIKIKYNINKFIKKILTTEKKKDFFINLIFVNDKKIKKINTDYRLKKSETDVIAFNYKEKKYLGGDIFISVDTAKRNAKRYGESFDDEVLRLVAHGVLHVIGYNHSNEFKKMETMNIKQEKCIKEFLKEC